MASLKRGTAGSPDLRSPPPDYVANAWSDYSGLAADEKGFTISFQTKRRDQ
jgi:hypothetical protein